MFSTVHGSWGSSQGHSCPSCMTLGLHSFCCRKVPLPRSVSESLAWWWGKTWAQSFTLLMARTYPFLSSTCCLTILWFFLVFSLSFLIPILPSTSPAPSPVTRPTDNNFQKLKVVRNFPRLFQLLINMNISVGIQGGMLLWAECETLFPILTWSVHPSRRK